jgi:cytochrome c oxidase assembly protein subunit 15
MPGTGTQQPADPTDSTGDARGRRRFALPTTVTKSAHGLAIASLISQVGIIVTGGAVRLTGSGLGCANWPNCMPGTMTPTRAMGIHGLIEFGNRTLTFVLLIIAIATILSVWRLRRSHPRIYWLAWTLLAIIPVQAVIGGITVWTGLNPWVVSLHFIASAFLVCTAALLVNRTGLAVRPHEGGLAGGSVPAGLRPLSWAAWILSGIAVVLGTIVTGTGPHAGDPSSPRHDFNPDLITKIHVVPVYLLIVVAVIALVLVHRAGAGAALKHAVWWLAAVVVLQGAIGYTQHFTGLPILLVLAHMLGSALLMVAATNLWDRATQLVALK